MGEYVPLQEIADLLGVSYNTAKKFLLKGHWPYVAMGKLIRVHRPSFDAWVEAQLNGGEKR